MPPCIGHLHFLDLTMHVTHHNACHMCGVQLQYINFCSLPAIQRGSDIPIYFPTTSNLLVQYDFDKKVFEMDTPYQNVKIMHSPQFGNMLILDDDPSKSAQHLPDVFSECVNVLGKFDSIKRIVRYSCKPTR